jgi:hypothetical protein
MNMGIDATDHWLREGNDQDAWDFLVMCFHLRVLLLAFPYTICSQLRRVEKVLKRALSRCFSFMYS